MGQYTPRTSKKRPSITETLREAEEDHFTDCPDAELRIRAAAILLDVLFVSLAISGIQNLCLAIQTHLSHIAIDPTLMESTAVPESLSLFETTRIYLSINAPSIAAYLFISLRLAFLYFYFVWSLAFAGGSPGKLILGLRVIQKRNGQLIPFYYALLREVTKVLSVGLGGAGIFYLLLNKKKETFHDGFFQTAVKRIHGRL